MTTEVAMKCKIGKLAYLNTCNSTPNSIAKTASTLCVMQQPTKYRLSNSVWFGLGCEVSIGMSTPLTVCSSSSITSSTMWGYLQRQDCYSIHASHRLCPQAWPKPACGLNRLSVQVGSSLLAEPPIKRWHTHLTNAKLMELPLKYEVTKV
jgi:hypothetical protein